jgi:G3E family GTPase
MHLLLVTGFLGSGKTTLVIQLAQAVLAQGRRAAILVNEIGEIGIDNQLMRRLDLNVWELLNGCICCTLSGDLVTTLQKLDADYAPDLVIVEPSGAADPRNVLIALPFYHGKPLESIRTIAILDATRAAMLAEVLTPLITSQMRSSELTLISKCDLATPDEVAFAQQTALELCPQARVRPACLRDPLDPALMREMLAWLN